MCCSFVLVLVIHLHLCYTYSSVWKSNMTEDDQSINLTSNDTDRSISSSASSKEEHLISQTDEGFGYGALYADSLQLNDVYDMIGLGKAQAFSWAVFGLISYTDITEIITVTVIIPYLIGEWELGIVTAQLITSSVYAFYAAGTIIVGRIADIYGRKPVLSVSLIMLSISVVCASLAQNPWQFLTARSITGLCIGSNVATVMCYSTEIVQSEHRALGPAMLIAIDTISYIIVAMLAYTTLNAVGWRWFLILEALPTIPAVILLQLIPESPRYLCVSSQKEKLIQAVIQLAKLNGVQLPNKLSITTHSNQSLGTMKDLLNKKYVKQTSLLSIIYFWNSLFCFALTIFVPIAFNSGFCGGSDAAPEHSVYTTMSQESLLKTSVITCAGILGALLGFITVIKLGRLLSIKVGCFLLLFCSLFLYKCFTDNVTLLLIFCANLLCTVIIMIVWITMQEYYPTVIRATATGFINFWGKLGGVLGASLAYFTFYVNPYITVSLFVVAASFQFFISILLDKETKDIDLKDI